MISEEEAQRRKKAALSYDGRLEKERGKEMLKEGKGGGGMAMNIDEQIRQIHQKFSGGQG